MIGRLFEGGRGDLALEDPEQFLECNILATVQPPGKRNRTLMTLSGGERALSAIALLTAVFLYKPSPFLVLDEVDAPLDEANLSRFLKLMDHIKETTQLVIITHNRRTMEAAGALYGVTMPEPGVSQILTLPLAQAAQHTSA